MKKNKKIFILILLILIIFIFLNKNKFSNSAELNSQNIEIKTESDQTANTQSQTPASNDEKTLQEDPKITEKHTFTENELKEIQKLRSEAKMTLASNYAAMASFRAELNRYTTDLKSAGFMLSKSEISYKLGFLKQFHPAGDNNQNTNEDFHSEKNLTTDTFIGEKDSLSNQIFKYATGVENINLDDYSKYCKKGCTASANEFEILLVLPLPNSSQVDVWTINEKKVLEQVLDGTL